MELVIPEGWEKDSPALYLHTTGARIEKRLYREKEGWILVPLDLDTPVSEFSPDKEGLIQAFAAFAKTAQKPKRVMKPKPAVVKAKEKEAEKEEAADGDGEEKEEKDEDDD